MSEASGILHINARAVRLKPIVHVDSENLTPRIIVLMQAYIST